MDKGKGCGCGTAICILIIVGIIGSFPKIVQIILGIGLAAVIVLYAIGKSKGNNGRKKQKSPNIRTSTNKVKTVSQAKYDSKYDFIMLDFETATPQRSSACAIGVIAVNGLEIVDQKSWIIRPPRNEFSHINMRIHNITPEKAENMPNFRVLWENDLMEYLEQSSIILAYNANFDMSVLKNSLKYYNLSSIYFKYADAIEIVKALAASDFHSYKLNEIASYYNVQLTDHHNPLADAKAAAEIVIKLLENHSLENIFDFRAQYPELFHSFDLYFNDIKERPYHQSSSNQRQRIFKEFYNNTFVNYDELIYPEKIDESMPLFNKSFCFTGVLDMPRQEAMQTVINQGGIIRKSACKNLDYLVVGKQDKRIVGPDGKSSKERKAIKHNKEDGSHTQILNEEQFLSLINK